MPLPPLRQVSGQLKVDAYAVGDTGRRLVNEDSFLSIVNPESPGWLAGLFMVADGIGGRQNGHVASAMAVKAARDVILGTNRFFSVDQAHRLLEEAFKEANRAVFSASEKDVSLKDMGTTLVIAMVAQRRLFAATLGDSRIYLHRGRRLIQLTEDDWVKMVSEDNPVNINGSLPMVTIVNTAVGWDENPEPEIIDMEIGAGDIILLCTDGLTEVLTDKQIEAELHRYGKKLDICAERLVNLAVKEPEADNTSVVIVRVDKS